MARSPGGKEFLASAWLQLSETSDANELRILLALVLPLAHGLSTQATAALVGRSPRWVTRARNDYIRKSGRTQRTPKRIRNNAHMTTGQEADFLAPFFEQARQGGVLGVNDIHRALEKHLGHKVALASAYNLLHRHGWRKLAPDKRHIYADVQAQEAWKKTAKMACPNRKEMEKARTSPVDVSG
jgi:transposase